MKPFKISSIQKSFA